MVLESIIEAITEVLDIDADEITEDSSFVDDLGADSLDVMEIIMAIEDKFDIKVPMEVASNIKTVGDAAEEIENVIND